jgi:hypothetical protein
MDFKTDKTSRWVDDAAVAAHEAIERVHEYMAGMEDKVSGHATGASEHVVATFENRAHEVGKFIEENPARAAMIAFGIGMFASRFFKGGGAMPFTTGARVNEPSGPKTGKSTKGSGAREAA